MNVLSLQNLFEVTVFYFICQTYKKILSIHKRQQQKRRDKQ